MDLMCLNEWCLLQNMLSRDDCRLCLYDGRCEGCCICHPFLAFVKGSSTGPYTAAKQIQHLMERSQQNTHPERSSGIVTPLPHLRWYSSPESYAACHFCSYSSRCRWFFSCGWHSENLWWYALGRGVPHHNGKLMSSTFGGSYELATATARTHC